MRTPRYHSPEAVLTAALAQFGVEPSALRSMPRTPQASAIRQKVACAMRELTMASYPEIAWFMFMSSHASVHAQVKRGMANGGADFVRDVRARLEGKS